QEGLTVPAINAIKENEAIALSDEEIALDAASEARSNGSGSGGEEFDYDLTLSD
ncbi:hypothetical protein Tco_1278111, partial [Tanacetum coccineum]